MVEHQPGDPLGVGAASNAVRQATVGGLLEFPAHLPFGAAVAGHGRDLQAGNLQRLAGGQGFHGALQGLRQGRLAAARLAAPPLAGEQAHHQREAGRGGERGPISAVVGGLAGDGAGGGRGGLGQGGHRLERMGADGVDQVLRHGLVQQGVHVGAQCAAGLAKALHDGAGFFVVSQQPLHFQGARRIEFTVGVGHEFFDVMVVHGVSFGACFTGFFMSSCSCSRARDKRLMTVPTGICRMSAASW